jgi:hypothetical protein
MACRQPKPLRTQREIAGESNDEEGRCCEESILPAIQNPEEAVFRVEGD